MVSYWMYFCRKESLKNLRKMLTRRWWLFHACAVNIHQFVYQLLIFNFGWVFLSQFVKNNAKSDRQLKFLLLVITLNVKLPIEIFTLKALWCSSRHFCLKVSFHINLCGAVVINYKKPTWRVTPTLRSKTTTLSMFMCMCLWMNGGDELR